MPMSLLKLIEKLLIRVDKMLKYTNTNELYRYGVLGMKWGKRKVQSGSSYVSTSARQKQITKEYKQTKKNTPRP